jgi:hypothetical protein
LQEVWRLAIPATITISASLSDTQIAELTPRFRGGLSMT